MPETEGDGDPGAAGGGAEGGEGRSVAGTTRPLVLPETFDGSGSWSEWSFHFENVASVNGWDENQKLQWLRVRVTGRAQKALHRLQDAATTYEATRDALKARFDPESRQTRYQAEFQTRKKKPGEGWADFADDLRSLADRAYPDLADEARERLTINSYLGQLPQPQISFSVRQKQPSTLDDAVSATLEMESYLLPQTLSSVEPPVAAETAAVNTVDQVSQLARVVEKLTEQVEQLQRSVDSAKPSSSDPSRRRIRGSPQSFAGNCWSCGKWGHRASDCNNSSNSGRHQGN